MNNQYFDRRKFIASMLATGASANLPGQNLIMPLIDGALKSPATGAALGLTYQIFKEKLAHFDTSLIGVVFDHRSPPDLEAMETLQTLAEMDQGEAQYKQKVLDYLAPTSNALKSIIQQLVKDPTATQLLKDLGKLLDEKNERSLHLHIAAINKVIDLNKPDTKFADYCRYEIRQLYPGDETPDLVKLLQHASERYDSDVIHDLLRNLELEKSKFEKLYSLQKTLLFENCGLDAEAVSIIESLVADISNMNHPTRFSGSCSNEIQWMLDDKWVEIKLAEYDDSFSSIYQHCMPRHVWLRHRRTMPDYDPREEDEDYLYRLCENDSELDSELEEESIIEIESQELEFISWYGPFIDRAAFR